MLSFIYGHLIKQHITDEVFMLEHCSFQMYSKWSFTSMFNFMNLTPIENFDK